MSKMKFDLKLILILVLGLVVLVETAVLIGSMEPDESDFSGAEAVVEQTVQEATAPGEVEEKSVPVSVAANGIEDQRRAIYIELNKDVGNRGDLFSKDNPPATISPAVEGNWDWAYDRSLRFQSVEALELGKEFVVTLHPEVFLPEGESFEGPEELTLKTPQFLLEEINCQEGVSTKGKPVIKGRLVFSHPIDFDSFKERLKLSYVEKGVAVPVDLYKTISGDTVTFTTAEVKKDLTPRVYTLVLKPGVMVKNGKAAIQSEASCETTLVYDDSLSVKNVWGTSDDGGENIHIRFSSPVSPRVARDFITVQGKRVGVAGSGKDLVLTGKFVAGERYQVVVGKGLTAVDGALLERNVTRSVTIPDQSPMVNFESKGVFLSARGKEEVVLESRNVKKINVTVDRVYRNNLFMLLDRFNYEFPRSSGWTYSVSHRLGDRVYNGTLPVSFKKNTIIKTRFDLGELVRGNPGIYRMSAGENNPEYGEHRWMLITDLGLVAKRGEGNFSLWSWSLSRLKAISGAKVRLISDQNQLLAQGKTKGDGTWKAAYDTRQTPYMVTIEKNGDFSFLLLDSFKAQTSGLDVGGMNISNEGYAGYIYGERDIYRPGETVEGMCVVRDAKLRVPPSMTLRLRPRDSSGRELPVQLLKTDAQGTASFSLPVPAYAPTGRWTMELLAGEDVIGSYPFHIEEFIPDRISVKVMPEDEVTPGKKLKYDVQSEYLFGAPADGLPVDTKVWLEPAVFAPKGYDGWVFGDSERKFKSVEIFRKEGKLDAEGRSAFSVVIPKGLKPPSALNAAISARVSEQGGRGVTATKRVFVQAYPSMPGLKDMEQYGVVRNKPVTFQFVNVDADGTKMSANLVAELYRERWHTIWKRNSNGDWDYTSTKDSELLTEKSLGSMDSGEFVFTPNTWGSFRVVLRDTDTDAATSLSFYAGGWGYSPWAIENPSRLEVIPDKKEYVSGESASFQIRAPFSGKLLFTLEGKGVLWSKVVTMKENTAQITVPLKAEYCPNVYATAVLVRDAESMEAGEMGRAWGTVPVYVDREKNRLPLTVSAPNKIRPETTLKIDVKSEPDSVVTVAAVDEGILRLINQKNPDPLAFFYAKRRLGVETSDTFALLIPEDAGTGGSVAGGGEDSGRAQFVRTDGIRRTKPVAFWSGPVTVDKDGLASVSFDVPQFQGRLRLVAVGIDKADFGSATQDTYVKSPIVMLPTMPRFMGLSETMQVSTTVLNDTGRPGEFAVKVTADGPVALPDPEATVFLEEGEQKNVVFTLNSLQKEGPVTLVFTASGNGETSRMEANSGVRSAYPVQRSRKSGSMQEQTLTLPVENATRYEPETIERILTLGRLPLVHLSGRLDDLLRYPYGCIEQTTSRVFPLLYMGSLAKELAPEGLNGPSPESLVQQGLQRIQTMSLPEGGFSYWPGGSYESEWGSIYATHFLVEAKRAGFNVNEGLLDSSLDHVKYLVRDHMRSTKYRFVQRTAYGLYVLALAGRPDRGSMDYVYKRGTKLSLSNILLGAAYALSGDMARFEELGRDINEYDMMTVEEIKKLSGGRDSGGNFGSFARDMALVIMTMMDVTPSDERIPHMITLLSGALTINSWGSTQEDAFGFMVLGRYFKKQLAKEPVSGTVLIGGKEVKKFKSDTPLTLTRIKGTDPIEIRLDQPGEKGAVYYCLTTAGAPKPATFEPIYGWMEIKRELLDRNGKPLTGNSVKQGTLVVMRTTVFSEFDHDNSVIQNLLATGFEVENPRLSSAEVLPWMKGEELRADHQDIRDDRILVFTSVNTDEKVMYTLLRAVTPGTFTLPPAQVEDMYEPATLSTTKAGRITITPAD